MLDHYWPVLGMNTGMNMGMKRLIPIPIPSLYLPHSYQAKISLGLNTRTKLVVKVFIKAPISRTRLI